MADTQETRGWRPEPGESVSGRVAELERGWSDQSMTYYPIVVLETENSQKVAIHCFHAVLRNRLANIRPQIRDRLTITFEGKRPHKSDPSREVAIYTVDAPDLKQDANEFWQGIGAHTPSRTTVTTDTTADDDDLPF